jgi:hypothetical protein
MSGKGSTQVKNHYLQRAWEFFSEKVKLLKNPEEFYIKLVNSVEVIRLDISNAKDAYKLFETINDRGLKLSATDIIKNFLLGHASVLGDEILGSVKDDWTQVIVSLDHIHGGSDKFLRHFLMGLLKTKIPASHLIEEFKYYYYTNIREANRLTDYSAQMNRISHQRFVADEGVEEGEKVMPRSSYHVEDIGILEFSSSLKRAAGVYAKILEANFGHPIIDRHLRNLINIESTPSYTFLLQIFLRSDLSNNTKMDLMDLLESFILRRQICEYRTGKLDDIFPGLLDDSSVDIKQHVQKSLKAETPGDEEFRDKFCNFIHRGGDNRAKYILAQIEQYYLVEEHYKGNTNEFEVLSGSDVHLEHIIPQTIKTKKAKKELGDWVEYLGDNAVEDHHKYLYRIGNLTLLAGDLNIVASNNPFSSKVKEYENSAFKLNEHIREYKDFRFAQVEDRSRKLSDIALKIWH